MTGSDHFPPRGCFLLLSSEDHNKRPALCEVSGWLKEWVREWVTGWVAGAGGVAESVSSVVRCQSVAVLFMYQCSVVAEHSVGWVGG